MREALARNVCRGQRDTDDRLVIVARLDDLGDIERDLVGALAAAGDVPTRSRGDNQLVLELAPRFILVVEAHAVRATADQ